MNRASHSVHRKVGVCSEATYELGIADEFNASFGGRAGLAPGETAYPYRTVYDPFSKGVGCAELCVYQDARFILVGTPSGVTLALKGVHISRLHAIDWHGPRWVRIRTCCR